MSTNQNELHPLDEVKIRILETGADGLAALDPDRIQEVLDHVTSTFEARAKADAKRAEELRKLAAQERNEREFVVEIKVKDMTSKRTQTFTSERGTETELGSELSGLVARARAVLGQHQSKFTQLRSEATSVERKLKAAWAQYDRERAFLSNALNIAIKGDAERTKRTASAEAQARYMAETSATPKRSLLDRVTDALAS